MSDEQAQELPELRLVKHYVGTKLAFHVDADGRNCKMLTEAQARLIILRAKTMWSAVKKMKKVCDELNAVFAVLVNSTELPPKDALVAVRQKLQVALAAFEQAEKE